jgi:hypothetical protein
MNERVVEYAAALDVVRQTQAQTVLDVGTGLSCWPAMLELCGLSVTATDNWSDYWGDARPVNRHYEIIDDDICQTRLSGPYDLVTCLSTLEHIADWPCAVETMLSLSRYVYLTVPFHETVSAADAYGLPDAGYTNPYPCRIFSRDDVSEWPIVSETFWLCFTGPFWTQGERVVPREVEAGGHLAGFLVKGVR